MQSNSIKDVEINFASLPSVQRMRRTEMRVGEGWKFRLYLGETEKVVSRGTRMMIFCSSSSYWTDVLDDDRMILKNLAKEYYDIKKCTDLYIQSASL